MICTLHCCLQVSLSLSLSFSFSLSFSLSLSLSFSFHLSFSLSRTYVHISRTYLSYIRTYTYTVPSLPSPSNSLLVFIPFTENLNMGRSSQDLVEGDMILTPEQQMVIDGITRGSIQRNLWPSGVVPYEIESSICKSEISTAQLDFKSI